MFFALPKNFFKLWGPLIYFTEDRSSSSNYLINIINYIFFPSSPLQSGNHSYLLFHYSPSLITHKYNYTTVKFDPCEEQWTQEISDYSNDSDLNLNCLYSHNKFSKVSTILYMIQK